MTMLLRMSRFAVLLALACSLGLHWFMLQSLAWTAMLSQNLRDHSLAAAVERTFDGKHPCALCLAIAKGKSSEKKSDFTPLTQRLEFPAWTDSFAFFPPTQFELLGPVVAEGDTLTFPPPTPPPRA